MAYGERGHTNGIKVTVEAGMGTKEYEMTDANCFVFNSDSTLKVGTGGYNDHHNYIEGETKMIFNFDKVINIESL